MGVEETKHDLWLKRAQVIVAILAGLATFIFGVYNFFAKKPEEEKPPARTQNVTPANPQQSGALRSAVEETGASLIRSFGKKWESKSTDATSE